MKKQFIKITESESKYRHLERMSVKDLLTSMNQEDALVPAAVEKAIPQIEELVKAIVEQLLAGGRLFYIGAGTSGRLGMVDASECPPTFGIPEGLVIGIIAGGGKALTSAVEHAEDNAHQGWNDLQEYTIAERDIVVGITASGTTPYVLGALRQCRQKGIPTGCIACNPHAPVFKEVDFPVEVVVGPEFITGSTRLKSGSAQKLILNMISTAVMIQLGRVEDNRMVHMQLSNVKLVQRGVEMLMQQGNINDPALAKSLLLKYGSVKKALQAIS